MSDYNSYNGRIAETLAEVFFKKHGYLVQKYGVENQVGVGMDLIETHGVTNERAKNVVKKFMSMPDFTVMKLDNTSKLENIFFIDVKYRTYNTDDDFKQSLRKGGELYNQAEKYKALWDGSLFIFLIVNIKNKDTNKHKIFTCYDSVNNITFNEKISLLKIESKNCKWIKRNLLREYNSTVKKIFKD